MSCLVIFALNNHPHPEYEGGDVITVLRRTESPGTSIEGPTVGLGFVYIDDRTVRQVQHHFQEPLLSTVLPPGADEGDYPVRKRRRRRIRLTWLEGKSFRRYRGPNHPESVHILMSALNAETHDKAND